MFIELSKITADTGRRDRFNDTDDVGGENGGEITTLKVTINTNAIRCFYPRRDGRPGTRLTFTDGGGFAVLESYVAVAVLIRNGGPVALTAPDLHRIGFSD